MLLPGSGLDPAPHRTQVTPLTPDHYAVIILALVLLFGVVAIVGVCG